MHVGRSGPNLEPGTMRVYVTNSPRNGLHIDRKVGPCPGSRRRWVLGSVHGFSQAAHAANTDRPRFPSLFRVNPIVSAGKSSLSTNRCCPTHPQRVSFPLFRPSLREEDQQVTHTHTPTENSTPDTRTHTRQEQHPKPPNEYPPRTLNNARRWRDDGLTLQSG